MKATLFLVLLLAAFTPAIGTIKATPKSPCCRVGLPPLKASEQSLYRLTTVWTSDLGKEVTLDVVRGHPVVIALFFTNCEHSCPFIVADMKTIEARLSPRARSKTDFVLVSIDPDRDTVEALAAYRQKHQLGDKHWMLLRGGTRHVRELASKIGFQYYPGSATQFAHSLLVSVLNSKGEIVFQQAGAAVDRADAVKTIENLVAKR